MAKSDAPKQSAKLDPLEAAKVTDAKLQADAAALGDTMPVNPMSPPPPPPLPLVTDPLSAASTPTSAKEPEPEPLREDGPTIETWVAAGYELAAYPPDGYAEKPSAGLTRYKAGSPIPDEWIAAARAAYEAESRGDAPAPEPKQVVFVVLKEGRANVGGGQVALFRKGDELHLAGYGEAGIGRLVAQGLELDRQER